MQTEIVDNSAFHLDDPVTWREVSTPSRARRGSEVRTDVDVAHGEQEEALIELLRRNHGTGTRKHPPIAEHKTIGTCKHAEW